MSSMRVIYQIECSLSYKDTHGEDNIFFIFFNSKLFILTLQLKYIISDLPLTYQFDTLILTS